MPEITVLTVCMTLALIFVSVSHSNAVLSTQKLPCAFLDSTNITAGLRHENGSISFDGVEYPSNLYAEVDYVIETNENGSKNVQVEHHIRGCLCEIR